MSFSEPRSLYQGHPLREPLVKEPRLTARQVELLVALAERGTIKEAAASLGIAEQTAKTHMTTIYAKLDVHTFTDLFTALGWLRPGGLLGSWTDTSDVTWEFR